MKYIFAFIIVLFFIVSCSQGISESSKELIKTRIDIHNITVRLKFVKDSLNEDFRYYTKIRSLGLSKDSILEFRKTHGNVFANEWNEPYSIANDRFLTLDKYLDYCKAHKLDPETYDQFLD